MTPDVLSGLGALLQGADGKGMPEIHEPRASTPWDLGNPCRREYLVKCLGDHRPRERPVATGDKQMRGRPGDPPALGKIVLERRSRRGMEREQTTFLELGVPDVQTVHCHIRAMEGEGFSHTHPRDGEQTKQRTVGLWP